MIKLAQLRNKCKEKYQITVKIIDKIMNKMVDNYSLY